MPIVGAMSAAFRINALSGLPMFAPGMSVAREIASVAQIEAGDIVVVAQKIVSKAEGRAVRLDTVSPSPRALEMAAETKRPAALMQLMLDESSELMRVSPQVVIVRHKTGHVAANAGIDASNVEGGDAGVVLLWPRDPDASARAIRAEFKTITGVAPAVLIADSLGRAWRLGTVGAAIGCAGITALEDRRGGTDLFGRTLQATWVAVADAVAAAAVLAMGEGAEGVPAVIVRGLASYVSEDDGPGAASALRPLDEDLFR